MISPRAHAALDWLFEKSVRDTCVIGPEDHCAVIRQPQIVPADEAAKRQLVVLNISSYLFRIVTLFDFDTDAATSAYLGRLVRSKESLKDQALCDAYAEFVNMICGAVNRRLGEAFPAGMSTPFLLENTCSRHVSLLAPARMQPFDVVINDSVRFNFTVCICMAEETVLDFDIDRSEPEDASSGELELF